MVSLQSLFLIKMSGVQGNLLRCLVIRKKVQIQQFIF